MPIGDWRPSSDHVWSDAIGWWRPSCPECNRRGELLIAALELIEPEHVVELGKLAQTSYWHHPRRHGGMVWYGHPKWPSMSYIDPMIWFGD
jgi:hypothetical protein